MAFVKQKRDPTPLNLIDIRYPPDRLNRAPLNGYENKSDSEELQVVPEEQTLKQSSSMIERAKALSKGTPTAPGYEVLVPLGEDRKSVV